MQTKKIALITGGDRGLGCAGALRLAERGTDVVITYRQGEQEAKQVVAAIEGQGGRAASLRLDVGQVASFGAFVDELGAILRGRFERERFDYLLNNAGHGVNCPFAETTEEQFDTLVNVHFKGVFFLTQALLPLIEDGGRILNMSSGLARFTLPGHSAYGSVKGAVEVLTRYLAKELGERRITVNALAPGAIATDFGGGAVRDNAEINAFIASQTALGRVGEAEDIGAIISLLLSDEAGWINGQRIEASGGVSL